MSLISFTLVLLTAFAALHSTTFVSALPHDHVQASRSTGAVTLPDPTTFQADKGTLWNVTTVGLLGYSGKLGQEGVGGDKCRSSFILGKHLWNCGDMECDGDAMVCGFSMGSAFYGTRNVSLINPASIPDVTSIAAYQFAEPWTGQPDPDPLPQSPQTKYGMDTSNIVRLNDSAGVAYVWEITRDDDGNEAMNQGAAVVAVTLGDTRPIATRQSPLLTNGDSISPGIFAVLNDGGYIYSYTMEGQSDETLGAMVVGRVAASQDVFDASKYTFLEYPASVDTLPNWKPGIPARSDVTTSNYGMRTNDTNGLFGCSQYGSIHFNNYLNKYMIMCNYDSCDTNFYLADNPWGPWSAQYQIQSECLGYGVSAHPSYSPGGSEQTLFFSLGYTGPLTTYSVTFGY